MVEVELRELPGFRYVEPNSVLELASTFSNDARFDTQWSFHNEGRVEADIDAPEAWDISTGSSEIVVGVIDSGIDYTHPDLIQNIWTNPGEIAGDGIDNDANGYVDDVHGYDFFEDDSDPFDDGAHGTPVASIIGGSGNKIGTSA
jgi:subtilisin family serine protease